MSWLFEAQQVMLDLAGLPGWPPIGSGYGGLLPSEAS